MSKSVAQPSTPDVWRPAAVFWLPSLFSLQNMSFPQGSGLKNCQAVSYQLCGDIGCAWGAGAGVPTLSLLCPRTEALRADSPIRVDWLMSTFPHSLPLPWKCQPQGVTRSSVDQAPGPSAFPFPCKVSLTAPRVRSHSQCRDRDAHPGAKVQGSASRLQGLWLAPKGVCVCGGVSCPLLCWACCPAPRGGQISPFLILLAAQLEDLRSRCPVEPPVPAVLGPTCLFLSQHLPGGQVEWVRGARPQLFLVPLAPRLL